MKAASLLGVLVVAKILTLAGHDVAWSVWAPVAYFWQDVAVALCFGAIDRLIRRPVLMWPLYGALVVYTAINVAVTRTVSSPMTWAMLRAARGPLSDSVTHELTLMNLGVIGLVVFTGAALPWWLARRRANTRLRSVLAACAFVAAGPFALSHVDSIGLHRNAILALVPGIGLPVVAMAPAQDWRLSVDAPAASDDLTQYRGAARGWNVVLVVLESTAARYLGLYGAAEDPTPALTALGRRSIVFDAAYSSYPESIKGFFATLCSREPGYDTAPERYANVPCASLAERLRTTGYRTALFHSGRFAYLGMHSVIDARGFDRLEDAGDIGGNVRSSFGVDDASTVARLLGWVDTLGPRDRFFATYLPVSGHHPYATSFRVSGGAGAAPPFDETTDFGRYRNALREGDAALGALLAGLRARHLDDRTLLVVLGDHGEAFGQHDGNFGHTMFIYDENVHVPYVIAGLTTTQTRVRRAASLLDTAPTILDLLGLPPDARHEGTSLLDARERMAMFFTDYSLGWLGLRDGCWKYVYELDARRSKLFDVCADSDERHDRSATLAPRVQAYRDRLVAWAAARRRAF